MIGVGTVIDSGIWLLVECNIGIVCACLPIMRPIFQAVAPCVGLKTNNRSVETDSPFPSRPSRRSKYNRSGSDSHSGSDSNRGLKGSSEHIVVSHELEIQSQKGGSQNTDHAVGVLTGFRCCLTNGATEVLHHCDAESGGGRY